MTPLRRRMIQDMRIRNLAANTQRVYLANIIRFANHFRRSPDLLGPTEIRAYLLHLTEERRLAAVEHPVHRLILTVCYATGLRISEAIRLRPEAIDSRRMTIRVEQGKGRKDRYVMLPPTLLVMLRDHWRRNRPGEWLFPGR